MLLLHGDLVCVCGLVIAAEVEVPLPAVVRFESKTGNGRIFLLLHNSVWSLNSLQLYICPLSETSQFSSSPFKPALFWLAALHEEKMIPRDVIQIKGLKKLCGTEFFEAVWRLSLWVTRIHTLTSYEASDVCAQSLQSLVWVWLLGRLYVRRIPEDLNNGFKIQESQMSHPLN